MSDKNHDPQTLAQAIETYPDRPPIGGMRGEGSAGGDTPVANRHETRLGGKPVEIQEESGVAFAETNDDNVTTIPSPEK